MKSVTLASVLRVGESVQASAVATLDDGSTRSLTTGWRSDVPEVATVTDGGLVTGAAAGHANIYVIAGGVQGLRSLRVVPDYHGTRHKACMNGWGRVFLAIGPDGTRYVADFDHHRIQLFDAALQPLAAWGGRGKGPGQLEQPCDVVAGSERRTVDTRTGISAHRLVVSSLTKSVAVRGWTLFCSSAIDCSELVGTGCSP